MRHGNRSARLGVKTSHRTEMIRNMALGLIEHGRIRTTVTRAKRLRPFIEKLVTRLKNPSVHNLRLAQSELRHRSAVLSIAKNISPKFMSRPGGYLRILKLATPRPGDAADMALIEWVDESLVAAYQEKPATPAKKASKKSASEESGDSQEEATKAPKKSTKTKSSKKSAT